jgi:hypothetical protein
MKNILVFLLLFTHGAYAFETDATSDLIKQEQEITKAREQKQKVETEEVKKSSEEDDSIASS